nr:hypothetical protein [Actinomycetota bacterium]
GEDHPASVARVFDTVLVAGRGVAAVRVVQTCQRLGSRAVSVHTVGDEHAPHIAAADESVLLGEPSSYDDVLKLVEAAGQAGAQAVHPCLNLTPDLAAAVEDAGLVWVGPSSSVLTGLATRRWDVPAGPVSSVVVLGSRSGCVAVGDPRHGGVAADFAQALGLTGCLVVQVDASGQVVGAQPGLPEVAGVDVVEQQLRISAGLEPDLPRSTR